MKQELENASQQGKLLGKDLQAALGEAERLNAEVERAQTTSAALKAALTEREEVDLPALEARLDAVSLDRDRALVTLTEAGRKLLKLEDER